MLCVLGGFTYLESKGLLLKGVDPVLQLTVMYPFAIYGSIFCDLDHGSNSIPSKDIVSVAINKVLHLTSKANDVVGGKNPALSILDAKHRSWQTHSDLFLIVVMYLLYRLVSHSRVATVEAVIISLVGMGFVLGVVSHLVLDMLTPEGIWSIILVGIGKATGKKSKVLPQKISVVPDTKFFSTGGPWETLVRNVLWCICVVLFLRIIYLMSPYRITFNL
jgi:membrane-bound metal-dependent hydrolase YbcI (DUF457 family)